MSGYWALVHGGGHAFGVSFPDVAGCIAASETLEGVLRDGREVLSAHLAWMKAEGDPIPNPRSHTELIDEPDQDWNAAGGQWHLIQARDVPAPRLRVNIMIDSGLLREADEAAEAAGRTRSGYIEEALRRQLTKGVGMKGTGRRRHAAAAAGR